MLPERVFRKKTIDTIEVQLRGEEVEINGIVQLFIETWLLLETLVLKSEAIIFAVMHDVF